MARISALKLLVSPISIAAKIIVQEVVSLNRIITDRLEFISILGDGFKPFQWYIQKFLSKPFIANGTSLGYQV